MSVKLIAKTEIVDEFKDIGMVEFNAAMCYQESIDKALKSSEKISKDKLFSIGHHTPFESSNFVFQFEDIPISLITFGLHEMHPFYNTLQRSFRYTVGTKFLSELMIAADIMKTFPTQKARDSATQLVQEGIAFYKKNIGRLIEAANEALHAERPGFTGSRLQAARLAQEQGRCILSTCLPTGMTYSVDTITLISMYQAAWNTPLEKLLKMMMIEAGFTSDEYLDRPHADIMSYSPVFLDGELSLANTPHVAVKSGEMVDNPFDIGEYHDKMDLLHFNPNCRRHNIDSVNFKARMSIMTYGQFQRHRTITRGNTSFTPQFIAPPLVKHDAVWMEFIEEYWGKCVDMVDTYGTDCMQFILPYGAAVECEAEIKLQGLHHFLKKRCCVRAQLEIFQIAHELKKKVFGSDCTDVGAPCEMGSCHEGAMYCGRRIESDIFENRKVI